MNSSNNNLGLKILVLAFVFVLGIVYFNLNKASIYAQIGYIQNKRNMSASAQLFFEKSYNLGNNDTTFRKVYVNSLVNSPLTIEAQERIVKIAEDEIHDSAKESAIFFLKNLKKEIHNKYPENYIQHAPYNQNIMHWGKMPITYSFRNTKDIPQDLVLAVNDAFDTWERSSSVRIRFNRINSNNADIVINFNIGRRFKSNEGQKYVVAETIPKFSLNKLAKMEMYFDIFNLDGQMFSSNQIYNTALHEIFHALGFMGHSSDEKHLMYMSKDSSMMHENNRIELSEADKSTLELLYKIKPDITNAQELQYDYIPYLIFGSNFELNSIKSDEAKKYIKHAPNVPSGYIDYAQTLLNNKQYTLANLYLEKALSIAHNDKLKFLIFYNLAVTNYYDANYELALVYINKAKEYKEFDEDLQVLEAETYVKKGDIINGIKLYEMLSAQFPTNIDYPISIANLYLRQKKYLKARKILKKYLKYNPYERDNAKLNPYSILLIF